MLHKRFTFIFSLFILPFIAQAFPYFFQENIRWQQPQTIKVTESDSIIRLAFDHAEYSNLKVVPSFYKEYPIHATQVQLTVQLMNPEIVATTPEETKILKKAGFLSHDFRIKADLVIARRQPFAGVSVVPVRWNTVKKRYEKLTAFGVKLNVQETIERAATQHAYANHSVLKSGEWYKVRIDTSGIFKITYEDLNTMGFDVGGNPANIALFGNGGGILPEKNNSPRADDLTQIPIKVVDGGDGSFDPGDYLLFYGEGPVQVKYSTFTGHFLHQNNYYDNYSYYFITLLNQPGKRIQEEQTTTDSPTREVTDFMDYAWHEIDKENIGAVGRTWYGEVFDFNLKQSFSFHFPNIVQEPDAYFYINMASHATSVNSLSISMNGVLQKTLPLSKILSDGYEIGKQRHTDFTFTPKSDHLTLTLEYNRVDATSVGYLDYFDINVRRRLIFTGNQMAFRNVFSSAGIARYHLQNASGITLWDITNPLDAQRVIMQTAGGNATFSLHAEGVKQFIAFNGSQYFHPEFVEKVPNQDLHSVKNIDFLIITYPKFMKQAQRLADFHRNKDKMKVYITTPAKIYNEFSSGSQDITAIRDFAKMIYDRSDAGNELKYMLLFGDASYDYKDRLPDNTNFVPCWESVNSLNTVNSIASDDYFGYLDDGEGTGTHDKVDIGIGRFPVTSEEEAKNAVDKCIHYATASPEVMGPWRNELTFLADDEDNNHHLKDAETLTSFLDSEYPVYNIDKIYVDAYKQISTPSGQRAPEVNSAINNKIDHGTLIFNYSGHGGEIGLGHEAFVQIADIQSWTNYDKLTVFITATCEFTRYDDPSRTSAGELVFLNPHGGGIALFTTSRATYASANLALNYALYNNNLFKKTDGEYPCFGDAIRLSKKSGGDNDKKFVLIGDPALRMNYPQLHEQTTEVNNKVVNVNNPDTLQALSNVTVKGIITDDQGNKQTQFSGTIYPTVFDKQTAVLTLGTDAGSSPTTFYMWKSILFKGQAPVTNGDFSFDFMIPKDIGYNYGVGRISYYFTNDTLDGNGYYENIIVGGYNKNAASDLKGPVINLFMNDVTFKPDDVTNENPKLFAQISDESGINTTGNGIGHDIIAKIDDDPHWTFNLNDYYVASEGDFKKGTITFPFNNVPNGEHHLSLKVWDIYNNSSIATLPFVVTSSEDFVITDLLNRPNPVTDYTEFVFQHNQPGVDLKVEIQVFQLNGTLVKTMHTITHSVGFQSEPLRWDCTTDNHQKIGRGMYVYQLIATNPDGKTAVKRSKLVFLR